MGELARLLFDAATAIAALCDIAAFAVMLCDRRRERKEKRPDPEKGAER